MLLLPLPKTWHALPMRPVQTSIVSCAAGKCLLQTLDASPESDDVICRQVAAYSDRLVLCTCVSTRVCQCLVAPAMFAMYQLQLPITNTVWSSLNRQSWSVSQQLSCCVVVAAVGTSHTHASPTLHARHARQAAHAAHSACHKLHMRPILRATSCTSDASEAGKRALYKCSTILLKMFSCGRHALFASPASQKGFFLWMEVCPSWHMHVCGVSKPHSLSRRSDDRVCTRDLSAVVSLLLLLMLHIYTGHATTAGCQATSSQAVAGVTSSAMLPAIVARIVPRRAAQAYAQT